MMRHLTKVMVWAIVFWPAQASAGQFYEIHPPWLQFVYHLLLLVLIAGSAFVGYSIFGAMRGGKLGRPWLFISAALGIMLLRTIFGFLGILGVAYFKALLFAGLDILFIALFLTGMVLYRESLH